MKTVAVVIADDHPIIRTAIKNTLKKNDKVEILAEANNGIELLAIMDDVIPDIAIIDLEMPMMNGYETILELHTSFPQVKTIAFSGFLTTTNQQRAIEMGAHATVSKADPSDSLMKALESVINGKTYHATVTTCFDIEGPEDNDNAILTLREKQILTMIAQGKSSKQISEECNISKWTVDKHRANIREKLGLNNLAEMVKYAIEYGYIDIG